MATTIVKNINPCPVCGEEMVICKHILSAKVWKRRDGLDIDKIYYTIEHVKAVTDEDSSYSLEEYNNETEAEHELWWHRRELLAYKFDSAEEAIKEWDYIVKTTNAEDVD